MTDELIEQVARDIADALGDNFDYAFAGKSDWVAHRGETPAGFRDVNQPYKPDYIDAAIAALTQLEAARTQGWNEAIEAAARDCEENAQNAMENGYSEAAEGMGDAAEFIRALTKENSDASSD